MTNVHARVAPGSLVLLTDPHCQQYPEIQGYVADQPATAMARLKSGATTAITAQPHHARHAVDYAIEHGRPVVVTGPSSGAWTTALDRPARVVDLDQLHVLGSDLSGLDTPIVVVGDIHQCWRSYQDLCEQAESVFGDAVLVVGVGDLFDKGGLNVSDVTATARVLRADFAAGKFLSVMGNHDHVLTKRLTKALTYDTVPSQFTPRALLSEGPKEATATLCWIQALPLHLRAASDTVVVHAGWDESLTVSTTGLRQQEAVYLYGPRPPAGAPRFDGRGKHLTVDWALDYSGHNIVVHGHSTQPDVRVVGQVVNVDTGCVDGGRLTGYLVGGDLDDPRSFISVPANPGDIRPARAPRHDSTHHLVEHIAA